MDIEKTRLGIVKIRAGHQYDKYGKDLKISKKEYIQEQVDAYLERVAKKAKSNTSKNNPLPQSRSKP